MIKIHIFEIKKLIIIILNFKFFYQTNILDLKKYFNIFILIYYKFKTIKHYIHYKYIYYIILYYIIL